MVVLCAEQGFAGTFNERVLDAAASHLKAASAELLVVGYRGAMVAAERGLVFGWSAPMVAHAEEVPLLACRITDALYSRLEKGEASRVRVVHASPHTRPRLKSSNGPCCRSTSRASRWHRARSLR